MSYQLVFTAHFDKIFGKLDAPRKARINKLFDKIKANPRVGKELHGKWDYFSLRFEGFRLIYTVNEKEKTVILLDVGKRDVIFR